MSCWNQFDVVTKTNSHINSVLNHECDCAHLQRAALDDKDEVLVTTAERRAKLQSIRHHQQTKQRMFYMSDALPVAQPTVSKH